MTTWAGAGRAQTLSVPEARIVAAVDETVQEAVAFLERIVNINSVGRHARSGR